MHIIRFLTEDHRNISALFARLPAAIDDPVELEHLRTLISEHLSRHAAVEEQVFYPALLDVADEDRLEVLRALEDHHVVEQSLLEALAIPSTDERLPAKLLLLADTVPRHIEQEEDVLFDMARRLLKEPQLEELGDRAEAVKEAAPTRPHPHLTGRPLLQHVLGVPVGLFDRVLTTGRRVLGPILGDARKQETA